MKMAAEQGDNAAKSGRSIEAVAEISRRRKESDHRKENDNAHYLYPSQILVFDSIRPRPYLVSRAGPRIKLSPANCYILKKELGIAPQLLRSRDLRRHVLHLISKIEGDRMRRETWREVAASSGRTRH